MASILDSLKAEVNIFEGLTQEQTNLVNEAIENYVVKDPEDGYAAERNNAYSDEGERISEDAMLGLVENEVNEVYAMDLIRVMEVRCVKDNNYYFDDINVRLGLFKGVLYGIMFFLF